MGTTNGQKILKGVGHALDILEDFNAGMYEGKLKSEVAKRLKPEGLTLSGPQMDEVLIQLEEVKGVERDGRKLKINERTYERPDTYPPRADGKGEQAPKKLLDVEDDVASPMKGKTEPVDKGDWMSIRARAKPIFDAVFAAVKYAGVKKSDLVQYAMNGYKSLPGLGWELDGPLFLRILRISTGRTFPEKTDDGAEWYIRKKFYNEKYGKKRTPTRKTSGKGVIEIDLTETGAPVALDPDGTVSVQFAEPVLLEFALGATVISGEWLALALAPNDGTYTSGDPIRTTLENNALTYVGEFQVKLLIPVGTEGTGVLEATWHKLSLQQ